MLGEVFCFTRENCSFGQAREKELKRQKALEKAAKLQVIMVIVFLE